MAYSWTKQVARPETDGAEEMTRYSPTRSAVLWDVHNAAFGMLRRRGVPVRMVRYEDFLADPVATTAAIAAFADLPLPDDALGLPRPPTTSNWPPGTARPATRCVFETGRHGHSPATMSGAQAPAANSAGWSPLSPRRCSTPTDTASDRHD